MKKLLISIFLTVFVLSTFGQEPANLPAGTTWGTARSWINVFKNAAYDSLESHRNAIDLNYSFIQSHADSITRITDTLLLLRAPLTNPVFIGLIKINTDTVATLADLRSFQFSVDTTSLSARIDLKAPINNPVFTGIVKLVTDTLITKADARQLLASGGDASLVVGDGTAGPFFDGTSDGGQLLKFYGDNGFYTGLQGGAPTANRSYRLPIDALPSTGDSSLINIDQWGNMGFVPHNHYVKVADTINTEPGSYPSLWMFQQGMSNKVFVADSNKTSKGGYVTPKALMDSINLYAGGMTQEAVSNLVHDTISKYLLEAEPGVALGDSGIVYLTPEQVMDSILANAGNAAGITLNGGTLTLTGADALTFETGGDYTYTLPQTSGGTLMLMSEIQTAIRDSLLLYAKLSDLTEGGISISAVYQAIADSAVKISDIRPYFVFGAGTGADADSTLFAKGAKAFGSFRIIEDSLYTYSFTNLYMSSGDSIKMNVYIGNGMTRVATDSLFTAPQGVGSHFATLTPNKTRTIPKDKDVWVGIIGPQPANMRPKEWVLQLNAKIVRD